MDETPEELEQIRREAALIDPYKSRRRWRIITAVLVGAMGAAAVAVVMEGSDRARNPCERVRDYLCKKEPAGLPCESYKTMVDESVTEPSKAARGFLRGQCDTKIERLKIDEGIVVP